MKKAFTVTTEELAFLMERMPARTVLNTEFGSGGTTRLFLDFDKDEDFKVGCELRDYRLAQAA